jgi:hypothetical protein
MAFEGKIGTIDSQLVSVWLWEASTYAASFSSTYWIAHLPSILPTAKPDASGKQLTTLVCHFRGLCIVL